MQSRFINCNKSVPLMGMIKGVRCACEDGVVYGKSLYLMLNFAVDLKLS